MRLPNALIAAGMSTRVYFVSLGGFGVGLTLYLLAAMVALYRPGPMQHIPRYIDGKHGRITITYEDDRFPLKPMQTISITGRQWLQWCGTEGHRDPRLRPAVELLPATRPSVA